MLKKNAILLAVFLCAVATTGCGQNHSAEFAKADELFKQKRYESCLKVLEEVRAKDPNAQYSGHIFKAKAPINEVIGEMQTLVKLTESHNEIRRASKKFEEDLRGL